MPIGDASGDAHVISLTAAAVRVGTEVPMADASRAARGRLEERGVRRATALGRIGMRVGRSLDA